MIHMSAYWSFDPKRYNRRNAIAKLHRTRVRGRQGSALAAGVVERSKTPKKAASLIRKFADSA